MKEFIINENEAGQRFDKYLAKLLKEAPKSFFYKCQRRILAKLEIGQFLAKNRCIVFRFKKEKSTQTRLFRDHSANHFLSSLPKTGV